MKYVIIAHVYLIFNSIYVNTLRNTQNTFYFILIINLFNLLALEETRLHQFYYLWADESNHQFSCKIVN